MKPEDWTTSLAIRAAWLSFIGRSTQGEIAERLGVSPAKVHRLISHAQKQGLIKFYIDARPSECMELEQELAQALGLKNCFIAPNLGSADYGSSDSPFAAVASFAGQYLNSLLSAPSVKRIGVGMGRTLKATIEAMPGLQRPDLEIVSISGSLTRRLSANPYDVVQQLQSVVGGEGFYLPVPYLAESIEERDNYLSHRSVQELLGKAKKSDLFVVGIGSVEADGHLVKHRLINEEELEELTGTVACSDLVGRFLDVDGSPVETSLNQKSVGLGPEDLKGARVVAISGGVGKAKATIGAARAGTITDLVIDECLAKAMLALLNQEAVELV
ncbi:sugar-binding transcriptional regulator [Flexibacterium corallicola]|uniref:sugar-binding transcriptional regulator n=1 Tax=Flexibacterium corallicola TaxID=3037259 RepID=UPI00286ECC1D|nr:sugar-binding domain-containing protein [Pseudovibrio sp. M1P-2-3]